ncbi:aminotransferase class I/II-fold pyridoxal phosphate-dependent enzyme, partial [Bacillus thuringiensis]|uniref:aminotransferase class I/II-fold pyridoxal phosphate-dependent enzyme n=1 Tax=Bacillus thuringiensis TaxID=1428 RepID=UPI0035D7D85E
HLLAAAQDAPGRLLFDEAYLDFAGPDHDHALEEVRNGAPALVTRTFSKAWGLLPRKRQNNYLRIVEIACL